MNDLDHMMTSDVIEGTISELEAARRSVHNKPEFDDIASDVHTVLSCLQTVLRDLRIMEAQEAGGDDASDQA